MSPTEGKTESMSGFGQRAEQTELDDVAEWDAMLTAALEETGGPMTAEEYVWADDALGHSGQSSRRPSRYPAG